VTDHRVRLKSVPLLSVPLNWLVSEFGMAPLPLLLKAFCAKL
jgi:hypothetical protein